VRLLWVGSPGFERVVRDWLGLLPFRGRSL
jgi:hypothetical protein